MELRSSTFYGKKKDGIIIYPNNAHVSEGSSDSEDDTETVLVSKSRPKPKQKNSNFITEPEQIISESISSDSDCAASDQSSERWPRKKGVGNESVVIPESASDCSSPQVSLYPELLTESEEPKQAVIQKVSKKKAVGGIISERYPTQLRKPSVRSATLKGHTLGHASRSILRERSHTPGELMNRAECKLSSPFIPPKPSDKATSSPLSGTKPAGSCSSPNISPICAVPDKLKSVENKSSPSGNRFTRALAKKCNVNRDGILPAPNAVLKEVGQSIKGKGKESNSSQFKLAKCIGHQQISTESEDLGVAILTPLHPKRIQPAQGKENNCVSDPKPTGIQALQKQSARDFEAPSKLYGGNMNADHKSLRSRNTTMAQDLNNFSRKKTSVRPLFPEAFEKNQERGTLKMPLQNCLVPQSKVESGKLTGNHNYLQSGTTTVAQDPTTISQRKATARPLFPEALKDNQQVGPMKMPLRKPVACKNSVPGLKSTTNSDTRASARIRCKNQTGVNLDVPIIPVIEKTPVLPRKPPKRGTKSKSTLNVENHAPADQTTGNAVESEGNHDENIMAWFEEEAHRILEAPTEGDDMQSNAKAAKGHQKSQKPKRAGRRRPSLDGVPKLPQPVVNQSSDGNERERRPRACARPLNLQEDPYDDPDDPNDQDFNVEDVEIESEAVEKQKTSKGQSKSKASKRKKPATVWLDDDLNINAREIRNHFTVPEKLKEPIEYFQYYFDEEILQYIVDQTNLYSVQQHGESLDLTMKELKAFLGIFIYMGVCTLPSIVDYWAQTTRVDQVAAIMPRSRFQKIRSHLHFNDNSSVRVDETDRYTKIRPLLDHMRLKCEQVEQEKELSVDECMVGYKGKFAGNLRQYLPDKPSHRWGFKIFVLAGKSGITYSFIPYQGDPTFYKESLTKEEVDLGVGASAVISLAKRITDQQSANITFDNWYTGLPLLRYLRNEMGILALGTIKHYRSEKCPLIKDDALMAQGRGSYDFKTTEDGIVVMKWADNKCVMLASTRVGVHPVGSIIRYVKEAGEKVPVPCPQAVLVYNATMGGVDLSDMLMAIYRCPTRSRRWYFPLFGYCVEVAIINSFLLYQRDCTLLGEKPLYKNSKEFRLKLYQSLVAPSQASRGRPSLDKSLSKKRILKPIAVRPSDDMRFDRLNHFMERTTKGRCRYCKDGFTRNKCSKCDMRLCMASGKNCFAQFHLKRNN